MLELRRRCLLAFPSLPYIGILPLPQQSFIREDPCKLAKKLLIVYLPYTHQQLMLIVVAKRTRSGELHRVQVSFHHQHARWSSTRSSHALSKQQRVTVHAISSSSQWEDFPPAHLFVVVVSAYRVYLAVFSPGGPEEEEHLAPRYVMWEVHGRRKSPLYSHTRASPVPSSV